MGVGGGEGVTRYPSRAQGPLCVSVTGTDLGGHTGSTVDKQDLKPILGQGAEAAVGLVPRVAVTSGFHAAFTTCAADRSGGCISDSPNLADKLISHGAGGPCLSFRNVNLNLFKWNGKAYGGEWDADLKWCSKLSICYQIPSSFYAWLREEKQQTFKM